MNWTKWLVCTALAGGLVACGGGGSGDSGHDGGGTDLGGPGDGGPTDGGGTCDPSTSGMSYFYVVNVLQLPSPSPDGASIDGFDLDGTADTVCGQLDYTSTADLPMTMGVDNALAPFLGSLANSSIQQSVDGASVLLLLELKGVDDFTTDNCVSATAYLGKLPSGTTMPMHVGACATESATDPNCRLAGGQTFDIDPMSFTDAAHTMARIQFSNAKIAHGRLQAGPVDFPIALNFMGSALALTIKSAQIDVGVSATALTGGVLGGAINDMQLLDTIAHIPSLCSYVGTVGPILNMYSDLMPDSTGMHCAEASIAIDLSGVNATKGMVAAPPPPTDAGPPGTCMMDGGGGDAGPRDAATGG